MNIFGFLNAKNFPVKENDDTIQPTAGEVRYLYLPELY